MAALITPEIKAKISEVLQDWSSSDFILAVVKKDSSGTFIEDYASFGSNTYDPRTSMFSLASNTKQFTALSVALLMQDEGTKHHFPLGWKTPVKAVVPDFQLYDPVADENLTFEDALCHRSGLPRHDNAYGGFGKSGREDLLLRQLPHLAPSTGFRESFQYGNIFYAIMALLPPLYKQVSFSGFLKKRVFNEAGLSRTTFDMDEAKEWGLVDGYFKTTQHSKKLVASAAHIGNGEPQDFRSLRGACGLQSCAQDMLHWTKILLQDGRHPATGTEVVPKEALDTIRNARAVMKSVPDWPEVTNPLYGLGFIQTSYRGHHIVEHGGVLRGYHSQIAHLPNDGIGIVLFSNDDSNGSTIHSIVKYIILDSILGLDSIDWNTRLLSDKEKQWRAEAETLDMALRTAEHPTIALKTVEGTYNHAAYGYFTLRDFDQSENGLDIICAEDVRAILMWIDEGLDTQRRPYGILKTDKFWAKYMLMRHLTKDTYSLTYLLLGREKDSGRRLVIQDPPKGNVTLGKDTLLFGGNFWGASDSDLEGEVIFHRDG